MFNIRSLSIALKVAFAAVRITVRNTQRHFCYSIPATWGTGRKIVCACAYACTAVAIAYNYQRQAHIIERCQQPRIKTLGRKILIGSDNAPWSTKRCMVQSAHW